MKKVKIVEVRKPDKIGNIYCDPRTNDLSVVEEIQNLAGLSMEVRKYIIELQNKLPSDEKYAGLWACLDDSKKSFQTAIKKLGEGYSVAFDLELEV